MKTYYTYILASINRVLYVGVTNDLERRIYEHRTKRRDGFTAKYNVNRVVWYESFRDVRDAIGAEKRIKGWTRVKKVALIEDANPGWDDISAGWPIPGCDATARVGGRPGGKGREPQGVRIPARDSLRVPDVSPIVTRSFGVPQDDN